MDSKNTIAAIALSSAVIVLWALFFVPEKSTVDQNIVCLLYTSPSPRDGNVSRMPSSA